MSYYLHLYFFLIPIVNLVGVRINKDYREEWQFYKLLYKRTCTKSIKSLN